MNLVVTRVHNVTHIPIRDGDIVNIDREWVLSGRKPVFDDTYVSRKVHAQLFLRGDALFMYNRHHNRIFILPYGCVRQGDTARVDGCIIRFGKTALGDVHIELDIEGARCPRTPIL